MLAIRAIGIWFGIFAFAFVNGALREVGIKPLVGEPWAHWLSALTGILIFSAYVWSVWGYLGVKTRTQAVAVGVSWFVLTTLVETFLLNRMVSHMTWEQVLQTYNVFRGELWPLVLIWIGLIPVVFLRLKTRKAAR